MKKNFTDELQEACSNLVITRNEWLIDPCQENADNYEEACREMEIVMETVASIGYQAMHVREEHDDEYS